MRSHKWKGGSIYDYQREARESLQKSKFKNEYDYSSPSVTGYECNGINCLKHIIP